MKEPVGLGEQAEAAQDALEQAEAAFEECNKTGDRALILAAMGVVAERIDAYGVAMRALLKVSRG